MNCAAVTITNDDDDGEDATSSSAPTTPATSAAPEASTPAAVQSTTEAAATPSSSAKPVNVGSKQYSLEWCSCECETAAETVDGQDAYDADGCTCQCWKKPQSINKRTDSHLSRHLHRRLTSNFSASSTNQRRTAELQQRKADIRQKRAAAWAQRSELFIPDPIWHDCKLPLTTAEMKFPNPGDQVLQGDGEYPLELPATADCVSNTDG